MAQHLWCGSRRARACEVCGVIQAAVSGDWLPSVSPICSGDPDDDGRRPPRRRPNGPSGAPRELEVA
jgi:hypothetical protein